MSRRTHQPRRGFTLIELLLVMVILVVLAGIAVPIYIGRAETAKKDAAKADINMISSALDLFETDCTRFPTNEEGVGALMQQPSGVTGWHGPYLKKEPIDPWKNPYNYSYPGTRNPASYDLSSSGPDGRPGTDDDIYP